MRKGTGVVAWLAWLGLMLSLTTQCRGPFQPRYLPRHSLFELTVIGATLYILGAYLLARTVSRRTLVGAVFAAAGLLTVCAFVWWTYHAHYTGTPMVFDWDDLTPVTPYHEQLAVPAFVGLAGGLGVLGYGLRASPAIRPLTS